MVAEGIIALIWAAAGMTFYDGTAGLAASLAKGGPGGAVYDICVGFLGTGVGATLAMLVVIACPITSGDTAFRSARLTLADWFGIPQKEWGKRLAFAIPCSPSAARFRRSISTSYGAISPGRTRRWP